MDKLREIDVFWITAGLSCDGDTIAATGASHPSLESLILGGIPGVPRLRLWNPVLAYEAGDALLERYHAAAAGQIDPFILVVEGSVPDESNKREGYWAGFGVDRSTGQPLLTVDWIDRLAAHAWAVMAAGTCAAYGGIHAMAGNPTGCMGLSDHLGPEWRSRAGIPIVNMPGCPVHPDSFTETLLYLMRQLVGLAPMIPLDAAGRPTWLFGQTMHEGCDRGGYYEQADFAPAPGEPQCVVKLGCWGPVVMCNVGKRGWMGGVGGCPNVGGICIGCTMPGFPDKFMPFMQEPPGARMSTAAVAMYGTTVRALRRFTRISMEEAPDWRRRDRAPGENEDRG